MPNVFIDTSLPLTELKHYGVKGMKWGITRRSTSSSSSSSGESTKTKKTKADLVKGSTTSGKSPEKSKSSNSTTKTTASPSKKAKSMTDTELRDAINRLNMERQYVDLVTPKNVATGKSAVRQVIEKSLQTTAQTYITRGLGLGVEALAKKVSGGTIDLSTQKKKKESD